MSKTLNLSKYELTALGKVKLEKGGRIAITPSKEGDRFFDCKVENLSDSLAEELYNREDGRGKQFLKLKSEARAEAKAQLNGKK